MKTRSFIVLVLIMCTLFSCQQEKTLTVTTIKNVTREHQMIYVWSLNAILNEENEVSDFIFGGEEKNAIYAKDYKAALREWWEIHSKKDLEETITALTNGQVHHPAFMEKYKDFFDSTEVQFQQNLKETPEDNDLDTLLWKNKMLFKSKGILAWDVLRATALIGWGYHAEYLTIDEAYILSITLGTTVQQHFKSYEELYENYLAGYLYWSRDIAAYHERAAVVNALVKDPKSAWNVFPFRYDMTKQ